MPYTIRFSSRNTREISSAKAATALEALALVHARGSRGDEIEFIRSPQEGEIGVEMLRVLAKEEGEEVTLSADREHAPTTMLRKLWLRASRLLSS